MRSGCSRSAENPFEAAGAFANDLVTSAEPDIGATSGGRSDFEQQVYGESYPSSNVGDAVMHRSLNSGVQHSILQNQGNISTIKGKEDDVLCKMCANEYVSVEGLSRKRDEKMVVGRTLNQQRQRTFYIREPVCACLCN